MQYHRLWNRWVGTEEFKASRGLKAIETSSKLDKEDEELIRATSEPITVVNESKTETEIVRDKYLKELGKEVPANKKNDIKWMEKKIVEQGYRKAQENNN